MHSDTATKTAPILLVREYIALTGEARAALTDAQVATYRAAINACDGKRITVAHADSLRRSMLGRGHSRA